jgi:hypothetical protein
VPRELVGLAVCSATSCPAAHRCRLIAASPNHVHPGSWISILLAEHASADGGSARKQSWVSKGADPVGFAANDSASLRPVFVTLVNIASVRESAGTYDRYCGYEDVTMVRFPVHTRALAVRGVVGLRAKGLDKWDRLGPPAKLTRLTNTSAVKVQRTSAAALCRPGNREREAGVVKHLGASGAVHTNNMEVLVCEIRCRAPAPLERTLVDHGRDRARFKQLESSSAPPPEGLRRRQRNRHGRRGWEEERRCCCRAVWGPWLIPRKECGDRVKR